MTERREMNYLDLVSVRDLTTASHQAIQTQNKWQKMERIQQFELTENTLETKQGCEVFVSNRNFRKRPETRHKPQIIMKRKFW